ncbi:MAG: alpha/beta fold hydrolase [Cyanobium sp.]
MTTSLPAPLPARSRTTRWRHTGPSLEIAFTEQGGPGPAWLLLPALSTISSRQEWEPFVAAIGRRQGAEVPRLISIDWPGFGDSDRPRLAYDAALLARFLADFVRDHCPADCGVIAARCSTG